MALSIGVNYERESWQTCLMEDGQNFELQSFEDCSALIRYLERICAIYPEPTIAFSSCLHTPLLSLNELSNLELNEIMLNLNHEQWHDCVLELLIAMRAINQKSFCLPSIKQLPGIPTYRKLYHQNMGGADKLSTIATLLYRMKEREATWPEMRFICLDVSPYSQSFVVVENGCIVDGLSGSVIPGSIDVQVLDNNDGGLTNTNGAKYRDDRIATGQVIEQAFWEEITQSLGGLMAIHHLEDIVIMGQYKDVVIEKFGDRYQLYLFPYDKNDVESFEAAIGAAIIAEGLSHRGLAAQVVEQLLVGKALPLRYISHQTDVQ